MRGDARGCMGIHGDAWGCTGMQFSRCPYGPNLDVKILNWLATDFATMVIMKIHIDKAIKP